MDSQALKNRMRGILNEIIVHNEEGGPDLNPYMIGGKAYAKRSMPKGTSKMFETYQHPFLEGEALALGGIGTNLSEAYGKYVLDATRRGVKRKMKYKTFLQRYLDGTLAKKWMPKGKVTKKTLATAQATIKGRTGKKVKKRVAPKKKRMVEEEEIILPDDPFIDDDDDIPLVRLTPEEREARLQDCAEDCLGQAGYDARDYKIQVAKRKGSGIYGNALTDCCDCKGRGGNMCCGCGAMALGGGTRAQWKRALKDCAKVYKAGEKAKKKKVAAKKKKVVKKKKGKALEMDDYMDLVEGSALALGGGTRKQWNSALKSCAKAYKAGEKAKKKKMSGSKAAKKKVVKKKKGKGGSAWIDTIKDVRARNPGMSYKEAMQVASKYYHSM
jgi:hypothetical protein